VGTMTREDGSAGQGRAGQVQVPCNVASFWTFATVLGGGL
jgi:hypothetical protein